MTLTSDSNEETEVDICKLTSVFYSSKYSHSLKLGVNCLKLKECLDQCPTTVKYFQNFVLLSSF